MSQTKPGKIEVAAIGAGGFAERRSLEVGDPPLAIATGGGATWVAWGDASGIQGVEIGARGVRAIRIAAPFPGDVPIGPCTDGACVAWIQGRAAFFGPIARDGEPAGLAIPIDLAGASGGKLAIVPGPKPLVWALRGEALEGEMPRWMSALVLPGAGPLMMKTSAAKSSMLATAIWMSRMSSLQETSYLEDLQIRPRGLGGTYKEWLERRPGAEQGDGVGRQVSWPRRS